MAEEWTAAGHEVIVYTQSSNKGMNGLHYEVIRKYNFWQLWQAMRAADIIVEANISLYSAWMAAFFRKKWFVIHHLPYQHADNWKQRLKNQFTRIAQNIAVSQYVASTLKGASIVINNFVDREFRITNQGERPFDFCFLGRLVSDKGADLLIQAFAQLYQENKQLSLTIIGEGPDFFYLERLVDDLCIREAVHFIGPLTGSALVEILNKHKALVAPSKWKEPFGLIVLEALACGCIPIYASGGGMNEAAGNFGIQFQQRNIKSLVNIMKSINSIEPMNLSQVQDYLTKFSRANVAARYIQFFIEKIFNDKV
ncbi:MAG: glycosyltransferase [Chitinophagaceae bacterium]|nr:glycosyltransferase [Chitinophagaceae bacterium]